jgi:hypothetical protein
MHEIWTTQSVPEPVSDQLAVIARVVFDVLTDPGRPKDNVTEWAKSEACWKLVQDASISLNGNLLAQLADPLAPDGGGTRQVAEHIGFGVYVRNSVMRIDGDQWDEMRRWATEQNLVSSRETDLLRAASRLPRFVPTVKQCEEIWKIRQKLVEKGFA